MPDLAIPLLVLFSPAAHRIEVEMMSLSDNVLYVAAHTVAAVAACPRCETSSGLPFIPTIGTFRER